MEPTITTEPERRAACVRHVGPYHLISQAFARFEPIAEAAGLFDGKTQMVAAYYDDPQTIAPGDLRSDAGLLIPKSTPIPSGLTELRLAPGLYLRGRHAGPYDTIAATWAHLKDEAMKKSGRRRRVGPSFEIYLNNPMNAAPKDLLTDIYIPVE